MNAVVDMSSPQLFSLQKATAIYGKRPASKYHLLPKPKSCSIVFGLLDTQLFWTYYLFKFFQYIETYKYKDGMTP